MKSQGMERKIDRKALMKMVCALVDLARWVGIGETNGSLHGRVTSSNIAEIRNIVHNQRILALHCIYTRHHIHHGMNILLKPC